AQDITAPTIHITGLTDGAEYTGSVTPIFSASDDEDSPEALNLDATLDGAPFVAGTEVSDVGNHTFVVRAEDGSGNVSEMTIEFEILQP
ncbi:MAG: hypothetical protein GTO40_05990, partial [Deltaproteobacteria bacterium]|nr:hypothetical protein [Deltaproteobacteria bacterium]